MRVFVIAAVAAAASLAAPANAATITSYKISGWELFAYSDDNSGRFTHCAAVGRYRNGLSLLFSVSESYRWSIGFSNPDWNLRPGREFDIDFAIDGGRPNTVRGVVANARLIRATLPDSVELFNQFRQGLRLVVRVEDNRPVTFNLTDTNPMLTEVLRCAQRHKDYVAGPGNRPRVNERASDRDPGPRNDGNRPNVNRNTGVGSDGSYRERREDNRVARGPDNNTTTREREPERDRQPAPERNIPLEPTAETRAEASKVATDILRQANYTYEFQKADQLPAHLRDRTDAVWRSDEFLGTLRIRQEARADTIDRIRSEVVAGDQAVCKGKFETGTLPAKDAKSVTIFTSCKSEQTSSTYYIILPRRSGGIYLLGILGSGEAAARLQNVASAYRTVALDVIGK